MRARRCLFAALAIALALPACSSVFGLTEVHVDAASADSSPADPDGRTLIDAFTDPCPPFAPSVHFGNYTAGRWSYSRTVTPRQGGLDLTAYLNAAGLQIELGGQLVPGGRAAFTPRVSPDGTEIYFYDGSGQPQFFSGDNFTAPKPATFDAATTATLLSPGDELGTPSSIAAGPRHMVIHRSGAFEEYVEQLADENVWQLAHTIDFPDIKDAASPSLSVDGLTLLFARAGNDGTTYEIDRARRASIDDTTWTHQTLVVDPGGFGTLADPFVDCTTLYFTSNAGTGAVATQLIAE